MDSFYRPNRTLLEMLIDTGYDIPEPELDAFESLPAFLRLFPTPDSLQRIFQPLPGTLAAQRQPNGMMVTFGLAAEGTKSLGVGVVDRILKDLVRSQASGLILIANLEPSKASRERIDRLANVYRITIFTQTQMMFNPTDHVRVPKHVLLTPEEARQWLEVTKLKRSQMPRIFETDIQALYLNARPTDLIKVIRDSPTVGEFVHHLVVVRRLVR